MSTTGIDSAQLTARVARVAAMLGDALLLGQSGHRPVLLTNGDGEFGALGLLGDQVRLGGIPARHYRPHERREGRLLVQMD